MTFVDHSLQQKIKKDALVKIICYTSGENEYF